MTPYIFLIFDFRLLFIYKMSLDGSLRGEWERKISSSPEVKQAKLNMGLKLEERVKKI